MDAATILHDARHRAGFSQRALAERAGVPQPTIARIESRAVVPRFDTLDKLLQVCGRTLVIAGRPGAGVDRTPIRALLRISPAERLRVATMEGRNLDRLLSGARAR
jgi:transcriptional regulator with XRE-family HTH domain